MTRPRVEIRIDTLVLQGIDARDRARLRRAVERQLGDVFTAAGISASPLREGRRGPGARVDIAVVQGGTVAVTPGHAPDVIGRRIGHAVRGAVLGRAPARPASP